MEEVAVVSWIFLQYKNSLHFNWFIDIFSISKDLSSENDLGNYDLEVSKSSWWVTFMSQEKENNNHDAINTSDTNYSSRGPHAISFFAFRCRRVCY